MVNWKVFSIMAACSTLCILSYASHLNKTQDANTSDSLFISHFTPEKGGQNFQLIRYNQSLYELAYQIFLQNTNVQDAFAIAYAATQQQPANLNWHKRLITTSIWNNQPLIALDEYEYLARHFNDKTALTEGILFSEKIHADDALSRLLSLEITNHPNDLIFWKKYVAVLIRIGDLQTAIDQLIEHQKHIYPAFYYPQLIELYGYLAELPSQQKALNQYTRVFGITPYSALKQTTLDLTTGNVQNALQQLHIASIKAKNNDTHFWKTYAQMAWLNNNHSDSLYAYKKLLSSSKRKPSSLVFERLIALSINNNPRLAYSYATQSIKAYPKDLRLNQNMLTLAILLGQWNDMTQVLQTMPTTLQKKWNNNPDLVALVGQYRQERGEIQSTIRYYQTAIHRFPNNSTLKADYLNFLFENNQSFLFSSFLMAPPKNICLTSELWNAYASAYARIHNQAMTQKIVQLYYAQFGHYKNNPYWLMEFRDFLEQSLRFSEANAINYYTWPIYLHLLSIQKEPLDYNQKINYAKLAVSMAPGDPSANILALLQKEMDPTIAELIFNWALLQSNYPLADAIYHYYQQRGWKVPPSLLLTLALYHKENNVTRDVLVHHSTALSPQERIEAAENIGATALTEELSYQSLAEQRNNADIYDHYFTPIMLQAADNINFKQQYYQYGAVEGPRTLLDVTYAFSPTIDLIPYASDWFLKNLSPADLATVPPSDAKAGLKASLKQSRGDLLIDLGYRNNLEDFFTAKLIKNYLITEKLNAIFTAGYHQEANDTVGLLIGGMKQELVGNLNYNLTSQDSFQGEYAQNFFYTQDGQFLANGQQQTLHYKHQFFQQYPDWSLGGYTTAAQYGNKANTITGSAATLIPTDGDQNVDFFIPANFIEYGLTASFGENFREDYTHTWKPFANITVMNNTVIGLGRFYDIGIGGALLGKDHLSLYYEEGVNQSQGVNKSRLFELMYQFYL